MKLLTCGQGVVSIVNDNSKYVTKNHWNLWTFSSLIVTGPNKSQTLSEHKKLPRELLACSKTDVWIRWAIVCISVQNAIIKLWKTRFRGSNFILHVSGENWKRQQLSWRLSHIMWWCRREDGMRQRWSCLHFDLRDENAQLRVRWKKLELLEWNWICSLISISSHRTQKRNVQSVAMEKCSKKIERCRKSTDAACKQFSKKNSIFGNKNDEICGTDSKTYNNECDLSRATCLWVSNCVNLRYII